MLPGLILLGIVIFIIIWAGAAYNGLVSLKNQVDNAWSQIDVQLKRRYDLIPNLVEVVKDYMEYEKDTLEKVIQARNMAMSATGVKDQAKAEGVLTGALKSLFALNESYPDLKANQNVKELQEELTSTENKISFARQFYNDSVMRMNTKCEVVPTNIIAGMFGFKQRDYFDIPDAETAVPKVDLSPDK